MNYWEMLQKFSSIVEKVQDWMDDSPPNLALSCDEILREKIKTSLTKYALYDEVNMHIPQELRIRSRGTERHSASN